MAVGGHGVAQDSGWRVSAQSFGREGDTTRTEGRKVVAGPEGEAGKVTANRRHGIDATYTNGCRCDECRDAHRTAVRGYRARAIATNSFTHGTNYGFDCGCRCTSCTAAKRAGRRRHVQRKSHTDTVRCPVCHEAIGLFRDGSIARHGNPPCEGSRHFPRPRTVVVVGYWRDYAECLGMNTSIFYPEQGDSIAPARRTCRACPVQAECLNDALISNDQHGIRGGLTQRERRRLKPGYAA